MLLKLHFLGIGPDCKIARINSYKSWPRINTNGHIHMQCSIGVDLSWQLTAMLWTVKSFSCLSFSISVSIRLWLQSHLPSVIRYKPTASPKPQPVWSKDTWHTVTLVQRRGLNMLLLKQKWLHSDKQENNKNQCCRFNQIWDEISSVNSVMI